MEGPQGDGERESSLRGQGRVMPVTGGGGCRTGAGPPAGLKSGHPPQHVDHRPPGKVHESKAREPAPPPCPVPDHPDRAPRRHEGEGCGGREAPAARQGGARQGPREGGSGGNAAAGVDPDAPVVPSCGSGVTAAVLNLALETLGSRQHRLYDGSWTEWGGATDTPVVTGS